MMTLRAASYRERLYASYVSANKQHIYDDVDVQRRDKNTNNLLWYLRGWLPAATADTRVVDIGCGPGNLLAVFERMGYEDALGVDSSHEQVVVAQTAFPGVVEADVFDF